MFCLTRQERNILLAIGALILLGSMLRAGGALGSQASTVFSPAEGVKATVNVNSASAEQLQSLPGIGPVLAARIIEKRLQQGPFQDDESLKEIKGIGAQKLQQIKGYITF